MKKKQVLALIMAAMVALQPQIVMASDTSVPVSTTGNSEESSVELKQEEISAKQGGTTFTEEVKEETKETTEESKEESKETTEETTQETTGEINNVNISQMLANVNSIMLMSEMNQDSREVVGTLATVRATKTDVYGIVGGKAALVGNYDQGQPTVPKDGIRWCLGADKTPITADANKYGNPESTTMTLRNIDASQDGSVYYLSATNAIGTAYSTGVTLHVLDASTKDQAVTIGENATLTVELTGEWGSPVSYQWYKGDEKITGATKASYTVENTASTDAGEYRCVVKRGYGSADEYNSKTVSANLVVGTLATVRATKTDVYGIVGGKVALTGNYDQGQPTVPKDGIRWCLGADKTPITADANKYGNPESTTMTLRNIDASQDGSVYYLSATNAIGTAYSTGVTLHVLDASAKNQAVTIGENATLTVELTGEWGSPVSYQWYKGDEKITGATKASYTVENAASTDAGEYQCLVQRGYGRADEYNSKRVQVELAVNKLNLKAVISRDHENETVTAGEKVRFSVSVDKALGNILSYQWYDRSGNAIKDNDMYSGTTTETLVVKADASLDGKGFYCVVVGELGTATSDVSILNVKAIESADVKPDENKKVSSEKTTSPVKTGDNSMSGFWTALAGLSLLEIIEVLKHIYNRKTS